MNNINLTKFIRQDIAGMEEYVPVASLWDLSEKFNQKPEEVIKLDAGENQFGYSSKVLEALGTKGFFNFYPDPEYKKLRKILASYVGTKTENIMVGSGSDELLDMLFRLLLNEGDKVINCPPTFGMYSVLVKLNRGTSISIPRNENFTLNIQKIKDTLDNTVKVIVICSPNNPTGTVSSEDEIISLLETGKLVIMDEAYFEFYGKTVVPLVSRYKNLIVLRTFSKWAGLAGLRLGYGIMSPFFTCQLMKIKPPYNVNLAANVAGIAALNDLKNSKNIILKIIKERERARQELNKLSYLTVYPSESNSLFIKVKRDFVKLKNYLESKKIAVRYYDSFQAIRLSIGKPEQNDTVIANLKGFKKTCWDSVIFDLDGVLIDVSQSYRQAIKQSVEYVLLKKLGIKTQVTLKDIARMKKIPGFNNDWDLSFRLIQLLAKGVAREKFGNNVKPVTLQTRNSKEYQEVKDIFQSYYLGQNLFFEIYNRKASIVCKKGLIANETLLLDLSILKSLSKKYKLGVATSRPRFEALFALKNFKITPTFIRKSFIVAQEDSRREKPAPDPLLESKRRLRSKYPVYVGDSVNDLIAANEADMPCIFVGKNSSADFQVVNTNEIEELLL